MRKGWFEKYNKSIKGLKNKDTEGEFMRRKSITDEQKQEYRRVAYYYYKEGLTQEEIAKRMQMSRQRVNRIISSCIELGIVTINIEGLDNSNLELETKLEQKYGLKEVRVIDEAAEEMKIQELGIEGGKYLRSILKKDDIIGFSRGRNTSALVEYLPEADEYPENITVTQLMGGSIETEGNVPVDETVYRLATKMQAKAVKLYAPIILGSEKLRESFTQEPYFQKSYEIIKKCNIAVVGIGTASSQWRHMISLYDIKDKTQTEWAKDVVGEVCTHFYDCNGTAVEPPFRDRIISVMLDDYMKIPVRIGIAGGKEKTEAISAAVKGGYINVLITDLQTAKELLA